MSCPCGCGAVDLKCVRAHEAERRAERAEDALRECARRIVRITELHSEPDACAVVGLSYKMLSEVIAPVLNERAIRRGREIHDSILGKGKS